MTLTAPLFLIGLVAVAIPIIVHLFNFRRYKKVYFSNVDRLEQLQTETRRQSNLRQLLILAARILAIVFLVLAFARPVIPDKGKHIRTGRNDVSIYIDNSFSMECSDGNGLLIDKAKTKAREIVSAYGPSDRFQLMTNDMEGQQFHWLSKDEVLKGIDEVQVSPATRQVSDVAKRQFDFLHGGNGSNRYAFMISDFQTSVADFADFPGDSTVTATLVPVEAQDINNVYIDSVALNAPVFLRGNSVVADVWLRNEGAEDMEKVPLSLFVNGRQRAMATLDIPAGSSAKCDMHFTIDEPGVLNCRVETTDYPITFDDRYYFTINVCRHINMLMIEDHGPNEFLHRLFDGDSVVRCSSVALRQMDFSRLEGNDMVLLDELSSLSTGMAMTLSTFVKEGGTLVVVVGEKPEQGSYNEALRLFSAPLLEGFNGQRMAAVTVNLENELYRNVFNGKSEDMEMPSVTGYQRLKRDGTTNHESIITLANGDDFISMTPCGEGRLYLVTAPLREAHTDFVRQALFVPTLYNMALHSISSAPIAARLGQAAPVMVSGDFDSGEGTVTLLNVAEGTVHEEIADLRRVGGRLALTLHSTVGEAGNYLLRQAGKADEGLSLNYARSESRMTFLGHDGVARQVKDYNMTNCQVVRNADRPLDTYLKERMEGRKLWRWCLALSLVMLLVETILIKTKLRGLK